MNKNKIFSAIMRGFEVSGINALSSAAGSSSVNGALQEDHRHPPLIWTPHTESFLKKPGTRLKSVPGFLFPGKRLQLPIVNERQLNLNQPVKDMGPNELKAYAELGQKQHDEANRELERRWRSYDDMLPKDEFVSIIDKNER